MATDERDRVSQGTGDPLPVEEHVYPADGRTESDEPERDDIRQAIVLPPCVELDAQVRRTAARMKMPCYEQEREIRELTTVGSDSFKLGASMAGEGGILARR